MMHVENLARAGPRPLVRSPLGEDVAAVPRLGLVTSTLSVGREVAVTALSGGSRGDE
jgi:hypothetical protein